MEDKTIQILRSTLERSPELWDSRQQLAELLWAQGDVQGTSDVLSSAPQWPSDEGSLEFAASVFAHTNPTYSRDLYTAVLERNPGNARAHAALARLYMDSDDRGNSHEHYLAANAIDPSLVEPHVVQWLLGDAAPAVEPAGEVEEVAAPVPEPEAYTETAAAEAPEEAPMAAPDLSRFTVPAPALSTASGPSIGEQLGPFSMAVVAPSLTLAGQEQEETLENASKSQRKASLIVAALVHVAIGVLLYFWIIHNWDDSPVLIVAADQGDPGPPKVEKKSFAKAVRRKPNPASSSARAQIITTNIATPIAVEEVEEVDPNAFGVANSFGVGLGFGNGDGGGGSVMFFGESASVSHAVFIVDFSGSMSQGNRIDQLKKELDNSLAQLPSGVSYNIIYYSHRPWLGGEDVGGAPFRDPDDERDRVPWLKATKDNIQKSREEVAAMQLGGATNWIPPVRMALAMNPPPKVIWLLTDGEASDREEMIVDMDTINPRKVRINTIGMEIGGPTFQSLIEIAEMTGGKYSIVMGGQLFTGGAARKFTDPKYTPKQ
ncbi:MAG: hypothetical protein ACR2RV_11285 [Verrucomicrobiales bacterium]